LLAISGRERPVRHAAHDRAMHLQRTRLDDVTALGRVMTVWAHPDDESYLAGGLMAIARANGQPVTCVVATPGDHAEAEDDRARVGALRTAELVSAMQHLGVDDVAVLGLRDGECAAHDPASAAAMIGALIADRRPDTVVTFGPDGFTGHPDHRAVHRWVMAAVETATSPVRVLFAAATAESADNGRDIDERFGVFERGLPTVFREDELALALGLEHEWLDAKIGALRAHRSQTTWLIDAIGDVRYRSWVSREIFVDGRA
jgi:LmbE family N-acetylglucosaminyl deacetylase